MDFNEILRAVPELSPKVLAERLKQLERDGVIARRVLPTSPPSSEYSLGRLGTDLVPLIVSIERWGRDYLAARLELPARAEPDGGSPAGRTPTPPPPRAP